MHPNFLFYICQNFSYLQNSPYLIYQYIHIKWSWIFYRPNKTLPKCWSFRRYKKLQVPIKAGRFGNRWHRTTLSKHATFQSNTVLLFYSFYSTHIFVSEIILSHSLFCNVSLTLSYFLSSNQCSDNTWDPCCSHVDLDNPLIQNHASKGVFKTESKPKGGNIKFKFVQQLHPELSAGVSDGHKWKSEDIMLLRSLSGRYSDMLFLHRRETRVV